MATLKPETRFQLIKQIGQGSFGEIFAARDQNTGDNVALKLENPKVTTPLLAIEAEVYRELQGGPGVPAFRWYGLYNNRKAMAIQLLDKSLRDMVDICHGKLSLKSTLMLADRLLTIVEYVHSKGYIHRDLKPENFLLDKNNNLYIIDYGLCIKYLTPTGHILYREGTDLIGTAKYASINACRGIAQSRRDDLESIGYILVYLFTGSLPWDTIRAPSGPKVEQSRAFVKLVYESKVTTPVENLCAGLPDEFVEYFDAVEALGFTEEPNYAGLRQLFRDAMAEARLENDDHFDWMTPATNLIRSRTAFKKPQKKTVKNSFYSNSSSGKLKSTKRATSRQMLSKPSVGVKLNGSPLHLK